MSVEHHILQMIKHKDAVIAKQQAEIEEQADLLRRTRNRIYRMPCRCEYEETPCDRCSVVAQMPYELEGADICTNIKA